MKLSPLLPLIVILAAGAARAEAVSPAADPAATRILQGLLAPGGAARPRASASPKVAVSPPDDLSAAVRAPGVARTSVDHSFAPGGLVGSAGFLCGRQATLDDSGGAMATGYDPQGKFIGAKLSLAF